MKKDAKHSAKRKAEPVVRSPGSHSARETAESAWFGGAAQSAALLRTVLDSLTYPLYVIDVADYHVRLANRTAQETCTSGAATCYALTHRRDKPCDTDDHPCPIEVIQRTGQSTIVEHVHYDKDGAARNIEVHAFPIFDKAGRVIQIIEYCVDITAQAGPGGIDPRQGGVGANLQRRAGPHLHYRRTASHRAANRAMAERMGLTPEQCIGLTCYECVHQRNAPPMFCPHVQSLADDREHTVEVSEQRCGGHFLVTCTPLFDPDGRRIGSVHVARDITGASGRKRRCTT